MPAGAVRMPVGAVRRSTVAVEQSPTIRTSCKQLAAARAVEQSPTIRIGCKQSATAGWAGRTEAIVAGIHHQSCRRRCHCFHHRFGNHH